MRILLADDHPLFRDGLASLLLAWGHEIVGQAANGAEAIEAADRLRPNLILMDVQMPVISGLEATRVICERNEDIAIVILTVSEDEGDLFEAIRNGARGYLLKSLEAAQLRAMLAAIERGEAAITPATAARILAHWARIGGVDAGQRDERDHSAAKGPDHLTPRELEVLELVTEGLRNKEIASRLGITENTAKYHLRNILEKLHAESRTELAARAVRDHLI